MKKESLHYFADGMMLNASLRYLSRFDPWKLKGRGVFETFVVTDRGALALDRHIKRLREGAAALNIQPRTDARQLRRAFKNVLDANRMKNARIRVTLWKDRGRVHTMVLAWPLTPVKQNVYRRGFRLTVAGPLFARKGVQNIKSIDYRYFLNAYEQAQREGFDDALVLNQRHELVEASRSNVFWVKDGVLLTPHLDTGCLDGITRRLVRAWARRQKISCRQVRRGMEDLLRADEAFLTNSATGIMPIRSVRGRMIGRACPGRITKQLSRLQATANRQPL